MCRERRLVWLVLVGAVLPCAGANADEAVGIRLGQETISRWRFGVVVKATGGAVSGIQATLPVLPGRHTITLTTVAQAQP